MAIIIKETFEADAPIDVVWNFIMDPSAVALCMPGAKLDEVHDDQHFSGTVKIKVGAITAAYKGSVELTDVDEAAHAVEMLASGREPSGGTARATIISTLVDLGDGRSKMEVKADIDLTGRIMQVGRGMIQGVSHQLFLKFVANAAKHLEAEARSQAQGAKAQQSVAQTGTAADVDKRTGEGNADPEVVAPVVSNADDTVSVLPLIFKAIWQAIVGFLRRLFGRA